MAALSIPVASIGANPTTTPTLVTRPGKAWPQARAYGPPADTPRTANRVDAEEVGGFGNVGGPVEKGAVRFGGGSSEPGPVDRDDSDRKVAVLEPGPCQLQFVAAGREAVEVEDRCCIG
jgi:hypothetical protein